MTETHWFMAAAGRFLQGINRVGFTELEALFEEHGINQGMDAAVMQIVVLMAPEPVSIEYFIRRDPYSKPDGIRQAIAEAVERGGAEKVENGKLGPTKKGKALTGEIFANLDKKLYAEELLPEEAAHKLFGLLKKVVDAAVKNSNLMVSPHLDFGANVPLHEGIHPLAKARRMAVALFGYRDDCHNNAWLPADPSGVLWDVLTQVWRNEDQNAAKISENNSEYRRYTEEDYQNVLNDLDKRGWIEKSGDVYKVTDAGRVIRQGVEDDTEELFEQAFAVLDAEETSTLKKLLEKTADAFPAVEEPETA